MKRTHNNGELRIKNTDDVVELVGWVAKRRNLGSLVFIDLRDRYGITQLVFDESLAGAIKDVRNEYILAVSGVVRAREKSNATLATGEIEVAVFEVEIINSAETTPLIIADVTDALEEIRLRYRYLDLRRPCMQKNIIDRHRIVKSIRTFLEDRDFIEVETPILTKSTPEGARDYLVPARLHPGQFYALPQSPQLFKQLLMVAGLERYYQIARCFRDEDLRADRQLDFTQVDIETSFFEATDIQKLIEEMMVRLMKEVRNYEVEQPFLHLSFEEALNNYGSDKPDNRFGLLIQDVSDIFQDSEFKVFSDGLKAGKVIKALPVADLADLSRKQSDEFTDLAKKYGVGGLLVLKYKDQQWEGSVVKYFSEQQLIHLKEQLKIKENAAVFIVCDKWEASCNALGAIRLQLGKQLSLYDPNAYSFLWVDDFPLFEYDENEGRYYSRHHPFTRPSTADIAELQANPATSKAIAYDLVLNGYEVAGGSLRIFDQEMQRAVFGILGFSQQQIQERFGFFIDAFKYGTPPHGGIAIGLDRLVMVILRADSIRDVIAFPKNAAARCPLTNAPSFVEEQQLEELHIAVVKD